MTDEIKHEDTLKTKAAEEAKKPEKPAGVTLICPKCKKKVIHNGLKISAELKCKEEWGSHVEDFSVMVQSMKAALICLKCKAPLIKDGPQIVAPVKKLILPGKQNA